jgi:hypothetical protein
MFDLSSVYEISRRGATIPYADATFDTLLLTLSDTFSAVFSPLDRLPACNTVESGYYRSNPHDTLPLDKSL